MRREHVKMAAAGGLVLALGATAPPASAGVTITAEETNGNVVMMGGGTLDLSGWAFFEEAMQVSSGVKPDGVVALGATRADVDVYWMPAGFSGPATIGPGTEYIKGRGDGDAFTLGWNPIFHLIAVPDGYQSGDPLGDSSVLFEGHTFESLGVEKGVYTWTWDTADGRGDFFTINIPAPGALALFALAGCGTRRRRR